MVSGIYKIKNLVNDKVYIGRSKNIKRRFIQHRTSTSNRLSKDIKKYGLNNFEFKVLESCETVEEMKIKEDYYIGLYESYLEEKGYNSVYKNELYPKTKKDPSEVNAIKDFLLNLPKETHANIKFIAFKKGETMTKFIVEAIQEKIKNEKI